ncbi:MAG: hypothetical protein A2X32_07495 [Elusimicrobia bacterium GWC2_64_44]|nr:MAG: hypothetical protein A2X32_07495 [Elusimicrobia bacterium GWC2_64_44]
MPGGENDTAELAALGRRLYFERGLSANGAQSCNDCHRLDGGRAGDDGRPVSPGARGALGRRNSPTVLNAGFQDSQFWDGRAADLTEQAKGPMLNPLEMAMPSAKSVEARLNRSAGYRAAFAEAFPGQPRPVTYDNAARAIAAFERTLISPAPFDRYLKGEPGALSAGQRKGLSRFMNTGCIQCHNGVLVGGGLLERLGIHHPYRNRADQGLYELTRRNEDRYIFKVPMLRNVTRTPPYFHDGRVATLSQAIALMARLQLDTELDQSQAAEIAGFLKALESETHPER